MKTTLFSIIFFLCMGKAFCGNSSPYYFPAPDFRSLVPFTSNQLNLIKIKKIKKIIKKSSKYNTIAYFFNQSGQLVKEVDKGRGSIKLYNYSNNHIVKITTKYTYNHMYDSLAYDKNGRIIFYETGSRFGSDDAWHITQRFVLSTVNSDQIILTDTISGPSSKSFTINNQNEVIKVYTEFIRFPFLEQKHHNMQLSGYRYRIDSVSIGKINASSYVKKYWFRMGNDTVFKLGRELVYKNELEQSGIYYDTGVLGVIGEYTNLYDSNNRLIGYYSVDLVVSYLYNNYGLLKQEISPLHNKVIYILFINDFIIMLF